MAAKAWNWKGLRWIYTYVVFSIIKGRKGRVEDRLRSSLGISLSVTATFVWRCLNSQSIDAITSPPSSNRAYGFPVHGFPMLFMPTHAPFSRLPSLEA